MEKALASITGMATLSALGSDREAIWKGYADEGHALSRHKFGEKEAWAGVLPVTQREGLRVLSESVGAYRRVDPTVLMAIYTGRKALAESGWGRETEFGVNFGSSRGATTLMETHHTEYTRQGKTSSLASPHTTLGNIASWVAQDLGSGGPEISHSITCSTGLHALLNGLAWIRSGMSDRFLVGSSEAPLTGFTLAQMEALRIYSQETGPFPCRALDPDKNTNTMVLGEGAGALCLEPGVRPNALALIRGAGYATEPLKHPASLSARADCLQASMRQALEGVSSSDVGAVILHAPGTMQGDNAERKAVDAVFGEDKPLLTSNKWKLGHTLGASGLLSLEMGVLMLRNRRFVGVPFYQQPSNLPDAPFVLVNAVGFGGNAVSILLERAQ